MSKPESPRVTPHWRSRAQLEAGPEAQQPADEFPGLKEAMGEGLVTIKRPGGEATLGRRSFFGLTAGVGSALATGCVRKPVERIVPFAKRPEDMIPGKPEYYATAYQIGETVLGVLVESQDGRPTKIEGNPKHESSGGATDVWAQASVLDLYDPDRSQLPHKRGEDGKPAPTDWGVVDKELGAALAELEKSQGAGLALVLPTVVSPTLRSQLAGIKKRFPKVRMFEGDWAGSANSNAALRLLTGAEARLSYELVNAKTILALDCDFLATEQDHVRLAHEYARGRDVGAPSGDKAPEMNRLYAVEPHFTITGMQADHRLAIRAAEVGPLLIDLCKQLTATFPEEVRWDNEKLTALFATTPETFDAEAKVLKGLDPQRARFLKAAAADL
ncbi:MAG: hypothetical protein KC636_14350, partial [Myxococcales bacterium]|nr:hypothetical protein [Myxococcales bacterium]